MDSDLLVGVLVRQAVDVREVRVLVEGVRGRAGLVVLAGPFLLPLCHRLADAQDARLLLVLRMRVRVHLSAESKPCQNARRAREQAV